MESHSSLTVLIDQPKGQHGNIPECWRLESMEIVGTGRYCMDLKRHHLHDCEAFSTKLIHGQVAYIVSLHHGINNWLVVIPLCIRVLLLLLACNMKIGIVHGCLLGC